MFTILTMLCADVHAEHPTSDGRIDILLKTKNTIYVFELKYKKSSANAVAQIQEKDYAKAFAYDKRKVVKIGINFSKDQRSIDDWKLNE